MQFVSVFFLAAAATVAGCGVCLCACLGGNTSFDLFADKHGVFN